MSAIEKAAGLFERTGHASLPGGPEDMFCSKMADSIRAEHSALLAEVQRLAEERDEALRNLGLVADAARGDFGGTYMEIAIHVIETRKQRNVLKMRFEHIDHAHAMRCINKSDPSCEWCRVLGPVGEVLK